MWGPYTHWKYPGKPITMTKLRGANPCEGGGGGVMCNTLRLHVLKYYHLHGHSEMMIEQCSKFPEKYWNYVNIFGRFRSSREVGTEVMHGMILY